MFYSLNEGSLRFLLYRFLCLSLFAFPLSHLGAQSRKIDSLRVVLKTAKDDTNKVNTLNALSFAIFSGKPDTAILLAKQASALAAKLKFTRGDANGYGKAGLGFWAKGKYDSALAYESKALKMFEDIGDKRGQAINLANLGNVHFSQGDLYAARDYDLKALKIVEDIRDKRLQSIYLNNLGNICNGQGDFTKAIDYYLQGLKIIEEMGDKEGQARTLGNIGTLYRALHDFPKALDYAQKALKLCEELDDKQGKGRNLCNIGNVYHDKLEYDKAIDFYQEALEIAEETGNKAQQADNLENIGGAYQEQKNYTKALEYDMKALKEDEELGDKRGQASDNGVIGSLYFKMGKIKEAELFLKKAITTDSAVGDRDEVRKLYGALSQIYDATGKSKLALIYYKMDMVLKDTLFNIDKNKALTRKELTYEYDKKEAAQKAGQDKKDALAEADKRKQTIVIWSTIGGLLLVLVFAGFIFRSLRITRKQKQLIEIKNIETEKQRALIEQQKMLVEEKNKDILDSINYAKRLQDAILPPLNLIKQTLPESFVLYRPKDIVAGDFYWMEKTGDTILIAAADCTGHGVPGALVSVVCSNALNRTVKEFKITETGKILDKVRELVLETFEKSESNVQDGMDISLASLRLSKGEMQLSWSGAYNSLWYVMDGTITEIPADKQPIGKTDNPKPFTTHTLRIPKSSPLGSGGAVLYLFTDGYADQFGGPKGKKFKYAQLSDKLKAISNMSMEEQKNMLDKAFEDWRGNLEQVDDVLIIGIRV
jgi:tetratricopeptide (TPR) repeat protein